MSEAKSGIGLSRMSLTLMRDTGPGVLIAHRRTAQIRLLGQTPVPLYFTSLRQSRKRTAAAPEGGSHEIVAGGIGRAREPGRICAIRCGNPLRVGAQPAQAAARHASRRGRRRGGTV